MSLYLGLMITNSILSLSYFSNIILFSIFDLCCCYSLFFHSKYFWLMITMRSSFPLLCQRIILITLPPPTQHLNFCCYIPSNVTARGNREDTSSVAFEVLIINYQIDFINLSIFYCLTSNINLFICDWLTSNFCFPKITSFTSRRERLFLDARF